MRPNRDVAKLLAMRMFSTMGFLYPVFTLFLMSRGLNLTGVLSLESVLAAAILLWEVPSGALADRYGKKRLIAFAYVLLLLSSIPLYLARGFGWFALMYAVEGVAYASQSGALEAYLYDALDDKDQMAHWLGVMRAGEWLGMSLATVVGGLIVASGARHAYIYCIVLGTSALLVALGCALSLRSDRPTPQAERSTIASILRSGGRAVLRSGTVMLLVLTSLGLSGLAERHYLWQPFLQARGLSVGVFGLIGLLVCWSSAAGGLLAGRVAGRWPPRRAILVAGAAMLVATTMAAWLRSLWLVIPATLAMFFVVSMLEPIYTALWNARFADAVRATALSTVSLVTSVVRMLVRPGVGWLADRDVSYPFRLDMLVVGGALVVALVGWRALVAPPTDVPARSEATS